MKSAKVLHNPNAGDGDNSDKELMDAIAAEGYKCSYLSTKKKGWDKAWDKIESTDIDFIIVAGGDGTVRKLAGELLDRKVIDKKLPIALLPLGTANNIAKTLGITGGAEEIIKSWKQHEVKKYDVGRIEGIKNHKFFIESYGHGVFPRLMKEMGKLDKSSFESPEQKIKVAWQILYDIILRYKTKLCRLNIDGEDYTGKFLLVEIMNTSSIGPNLQLAPFADPGDESFDVVLITESQRQQFADYLKGKLEGKKEAPFFTVLKAKKIQIYWEGTALHVDDEHILLDKPADVRIELHPGLLEFLVPQPNKVNVPGPNSKITD
ncbi:diacylglycerol kinase family protein [Chryseolinea sp. H1M3-3]|uniref:diacylglycerol/lipid kinase family protein n=1 Tax=Chryseolinea sp. H1M3-3 TaxID=3034144 RepID=UPI0023EC72C1|nr:diacylglycerol kinase family protein [Chryseolinea sp. H1M3-3]